MFRLKPTEINENMRDAKFRSCSKNCGRSWCPIIICEFLHSSVHANVARLFVGLET